MPQGWDERGRDMRSLSERQDDELLRPGFRRSYLQAFGIAAALGLLCGLVWTVAGLWHFYVRPLW
jgi:hypothetical protein